MVVHRTPILAVVSVLQSTLVHSVKVSVCSHALYSTQYLSLGWLCGHSPHPSPLSNHLFICYDCRFLPRPVVHILSVSLMFVLLTSVDCVAKVCMNGGAQDSTTCDCLCLPNYTGYMCESECLIECIVIHLRIQNMQ